jgi:hypothetical protein
MLFQVSMYCVVIPASIVLLYNTLLPSSLLNVSPVFTTSLEPEPCGGSGLGEGEGLTTTGGDGEGDGCLSEVTAGLGLGLRLGFGDGVGDSMPPVPGW